MRMRGNGYDMVKRFFLAPLGLRRGDGGQRCTKVNGLNCLVPGLCLGMRVGPAERGTPPMK